MRSVSRVVPAIFTKKAFYPGTPVRASKTWG
jgi:hypothetical protein